MPSSSADPGSSPRTIGKYALIRLIARGGMGDVHLARLSGELGFEKRLVIKTIRPDLAADPRYVELFAAEAKLAVALSHPNITPIYELGRAADGTLFTAMGWVDGPSLARLLARLRERKQTLELGAALFITRELLDGLAHAHRRDRDRPPVVHRDVTPRNVLVDRSGRVQIIDFGIAKPAAAEVSGQMGSVGYMAPEQARAELVDPRADVFGVGCVLYELLTLRRAFEGEGVWMRPSLADVPAQTHALLERALALDPRDRFADAEAFLRALTPILHALAPGYGSLELAELVTASFPEHEDRDDPSEGAADPSERTPATGLDDAAQTFATRLGPVGLEPMREPGPSEPQIAAPVRARGQAWPLVVAAVAGLLIVVGASLGGPWRTRASPVTRVVPPERPGLAERSAAERSADAEVDRHEPTPTPPTLNPTPPSSAPDPDVRASVSFEVRPSDARVELDGVLLEPPYAIPSSSTAVELRVTHPDHRPHVETLPTAPEPDGRWVIELVPLGHGTLKVLAPAVAWAEVWLDDVKLGTTPLTEESVLEGRHALEVRCAAAVCGTAQVLLAERVRIKPNRTVTIEVAVP